MAASYFFYDLETTGINPREARIMQFAGQRTDTDLNPIGEPVNVLIKLTPDVVPDPDAILITGITPQSTLADGLTEAEFLQFFYEEVVQPETLFLGFNTVRFDDEFMRFLHYRNFYDAYEWHWCDACSRWDILDLVRMTRALRPEGIEWPFTPEGKPTNRLELLTKLNGLDHEHAHDALNDVLATIAVTKMIRDKQPALFEHLKEMRAKSKVQELVEKRQPFVYTTGRYPAEYLHTSAAVMIAPHPQSSAYVYDLRHDPSQYFDKSVEELTDMMRFSRDPNQRRLPVKVIKYTRCPAVAPLGVMQGEETGRRIGLTVETVKAHYAALRSNPEFAAKVAKACELIEGERPRSNDVGHPDHVDGQLYDGGFFSNEDKQTMRMVRAAKQSEIGDLNAEFKDPRLQALWPMYKARNYPTKLQDDERAEWDVFVRKRLLDGGTSSRLAKYFARLAELAKDDKLTADQRYLLEELQLYGESIMPVPDGDS